MRVLSYTEPDANSFDDIESQTAAPDVEIHSEPGENLDESSMVEDPIAYTCESTGSNKTVYEVVTKGTERGRDLLVDNKGYKYSRQRTRGKTVDWRCCLRNKTVMCLATVQQRGKDFIPGKQPHLDAPITGRRTAAKAVAEIKAAVVTEKFQSASAIAERVVAAIDAACPLEALPTIRNLARAGNWHRRKVRPREPKNLDFDLDSTQFPDSFLQAEVVADIARHIILATPAMLQLLGRAKRWYIDGTFKIIRKPFVQLLSIHAFVKKDGALKHIPLCFVLMSHRRKRDYRKVFEAVKALLGTSIKLREVVSDFEAAIWRTTRHVFGDIAHRGCNFHWSQAIWRHIQDLGMARHYINDDAVHKFCRRIMALPFLPHDRIVEEFDRIEARAHNDQLLKLTTYVRSTWIVSTMWPPASWSCFGQSVRTNNDCESWHARLNRTSGRSLGLYRLTERLFQEAKVCAINVHLLSEEKVLRFQRKSTLRVNAKLQAVWGEYIAGERSSTQLLKACGRLYQPAFAMRS